MTYSTKLWAICLLIFLPAAYVGAQSAWVSDQFEVTLRTGPSTSNTIVLMLPSGTALEVLERDDEAGYARVRTAAGTEGWVLIRYLMNEAGAREQMEALASRLTNANAQGTTLSSQLDAVKSEYDAAMRQISSLESENKRLEQELADIMRTVANVLAIDNQNKELHEQLATAEIQAATLEQQNRELTSQTTRYWFMSGALVLVVGMILGIWLPRIRWQRKSRYDRF